MWALHKTHDKNWKPPLKSNSDSTKGNVSFAADTKSNDGPKIQVKKDILKNAKAYLDQYQDFQKGGTQG